MNVVLNDADCPYYQLYGPPPSYETVIAQTRGKISNPASPESSAARLNLQTANVIPNPSVPQCFFYNCNSPARLIDGNSSQCQSDNANVHQLDNHESVPFAHFSQYCTTNDGQNICVPLEYPEEPVASGGSNFTCSYQNSPHRLPGYPTDRSDVLSAKNATCGYEIPNTEEHAIRSTEAATGSYGERSPWHGNDQSVRIHGITVQDENRASQKRCVMTTDTRTLSPKSEESGSENELKHTFNVVPVMQRNFPRERTNYGGSLRLPRRHTDVIYQGDGFQNVLRRDLNASQRSTFNSAQTTASKGANSLEQDANSSQSNPSNNVILESFIFENVQLPPSENVEEVRDLHAMNRSINFDLESKHKLDRSKSLD